MTKSKYSDHLNTCTHMYGKSIALHVSLKSILDIHQEEVSVSMKRFIEDAIVQAKELEYDTSIAVAQIMDLLEEE